MAKGKIVGRQRENMFNGFGILPQEILSDNNVEMHTGLRAMEGHDILHL